MTNNEKGMGRMILALAAAILILVIIFAFLGVFTEDSEPPTQPDVSFDEDIRVAELFKINRTALNTSWNLGNLSSQFINESPRVRINCSIPGIYDEHTNDFNLSVFDTLNYSDNFVRAMTNFTLSLIKRCKKFNEVYCYG